MAKKGKKFSNQDKEQAIKHLEKELRYDKLYNIYIDPLGIYFEIKESHRPPKSMSEKQKKLKAEYASHSKKQRRLSGTRRRTKPKIRSAKKGRTVQLKGVDY